MKSIKERINIKNIKRLMIVNMIIVSAIISININTFAETIKTNVNVKGKAPILMKYR